MDLVALGEEAFGEMGAEEARAPVTTTVVGRADLVFEAGAGALGMVGCYLGMAEAFGKRRMRHPAN